MTQREGSNPRVDYQEDNLFRLPKRFLSVATAAMLCISPVANAGTECLEAVFFDLGDTLVENPGTGIFVVRPGAREMVADLQERGVRLGIITNVPGGWDLDDLRALLAEPEFLDEFEVVILSSQAPAPKPNPLIYTFAHGSLAAPRPPITSTAFVGETLSEIGNHATTPTQGARAVGMVGIHLSDLPPSPFTDYTIPTDSLHFVTQIVDDSCGPSDVEELPTVIDSGLRLYAPYPNPSSDDAHLRFSVASAERVEVAIVDVSGRQVVSLFDGVVPAGTHEVIWNGDGANGEPLPSGIYYARMQAGDETVQVKVSRVAR